jgi:ATP-binding cassette subfamily B protein RaxB
MNATLNFSGRRKTPLILQTEAAECGLACLAMVAGAHGYRSDLATLRGKYLISLKGTTLTHLISIAAQMNLNSRPLRLEMEALPRLRLPAILHWDLNHFVVLTEIKRRKAVVFDPSVGRRTLSFSELSKHFTGVALELTPNEQFERKTEVSRISIKQLIGRMPGLGRTLLQLFLLAVVVEVFSIASPLFMQLVLDHAVIAGDRDLLTVLGLGFLLLMLIKVGVTALRSWVALYLNTTLNLQMLARLFSHLLQLPMAYFGRRHLGDITSRFDSLSTIRRTVTTTFLEVVLDGIMATITAAMMLLYSWKLSLIVFSATLLYGVLRVVRYAPLRESTEDQIVCGARQESNFLETVRGMQSVKLFNRQEQRTAGYQNLAVDTFNASIRIAKLKMIFQALNGVLFGVENIAVIWLGAALLLEGGFSVGMLFAFISYKSQFTSRMSNLIDNAIDFKMLDVHRGRVADIALTAPEPELTGAGLAPLAIRADIEVRDLGVRYADAEPFVLRHINLRIEEGQSIAIIGPSGCGKTTLLKVMMGLLPPTEGEVLIGGVNIARLSTAQYRNLIGTVMQDDQLFSGSIADNISFFDPQPNLERIETCTRLAAIHDDILDMPMGYQTLIGDMGTTLSGGQKQRVLLARAFYKQPRILLLDEATSHLDVTRERQVSEAVSFLRLTRVIVAHRRETIASADRIFRLDVERASHLRVAREVN